MWYYEQYVWRLNQRSIVEYGYPTHMRNLFRELPYDLKNVDAVFEDADGHILFFSGTTWCISSHASPQLKVNKCNVLLHRCLLLDLEWWSNDWWEDPPGLFGFTSRARAHWCCFDVGQKQENLLVQVILEPAPSTEMSVIIQFLQTTTTTSKNLFWRYDQKKGQMDAGYPRDISKWRGVPANLDAAMTWTDGINDKSTRKLWINSVD